MLKSGGIVLMAFFLSIMTVVPSTLLVASSGHKWKKPTDNASPLANKLPKRIVESGKLRIGLTPGMLLYGLETNSGDIIGFDVDLAKEMANKLGVTLEIKPINWDRLISSLNENKIDLILSAMEMTGERKKIISFEHYASTGDSLLIK